ncbi:MAG: nucleoside triphosphate pyrophosphohydrolase [Bdellovibrionales bacterium]|nr:nucleoside triphosphate pyrophosphohydrolase [Bdellovibrionales bacterium]
MPKAPENLREFAGLIKVVEFLRGPDGCPWDKEQTHSTLTRYAIEEAHELAEAIDGGDVAEIRDELGDVLLQVVLHSEIARQDGRFDIFDVIQNLNEKMVRRHPHVFANVKAETSDKVLKNWAEIKAAEKGQDKAKPLSFDIPQGLPALLRAQKIGDKTKKVDFDWDNANQCMEKVHEEVGELEEAMRSGVKERMEEELGDLLFSVAQAARHLGIDSEQALRKCNTRFEQRFRRMQESILQEGKEWKSLKPEEREQRWKSAKK